MRSFLAAYPSNEGSRCFPPSDRPTNQLLEQQSGSEVTSWDTVGDWMDGMRTLPCKEAFSGVCYSSCDTMPKTSTEDLKKMGGSSSSSTTTLGPQKSLVSSLKASLKDSHTKNCP
ncbi:hypothetical protein CRUP_017082, partial [Coryphaenoides rupestris]